MYTGEWERCGGRRMVGFKEVLIIKVLKVMRKIFDLEDYGSI